MMAFFLLSGPELGPGPGSMCRPAARSKPRSKACAASRAVPVAVLCCCTLAPAVRIMLLTSGA